MELNEKGKAVYEKWEKIHYEEIERLEKINPNCETGWCVVEEMAETPEELAEVYVYGDTEWAFYNLLEEPCNKCDIDQALIWHSSDRDVTWREFIHMLMQYFDFDDEDWEWFGEHGITKEEVA